MAIKKQSLHTLSEALEGILKNCNIANGQILLETILRLLHEQKEAGEDPTIEIAVHSVCNEILTQDHPNQKGQNAMDKEHFPILVLHTLKNVKALLEQTKQHSFTDQNAYMNSQTLCDVEALIKTIESELS